MTDDDERLRALRGDGKSTPSKASVKAGSAPSPAVGGVNGPPACTEVAEFTQFPYDVCVDVYVDHDDEAEDGVCRQIILSSLGVGCEGGDNCDFEVLLSVAEARAIRDVLTQAIHHATTAPAPG